MINETKKQTKRELKKLLKIKLAKHSNGLTVSHQYAVLKEARDFAREHRLPFPEEFQSLLVKVSKRYLSEIIDFYVMTQATNQHLAEASAKQLSLF